MGEGKKRRFEIWRIGLALITCGAVFHVGFKRYAPEAGRFEMGQAALSELCFYILGFFLLWIHLLYRQRDQSRIWKWLSWLLWWLGGMTSLVAVMDALPP